tara:strand:- start:4452 stop:4631 length:180 start_codon:yes stop_codon:yes gene_type:complete
MAGIRGVQNPFPSKPKAAKKGVFKQYAPAPKSDYPEVVSEAYSNGRKGPVARNNMLKGD